MFTWEENANSSVTMLHVHPLLSYVHTIDKPPTMLTIYVSLVQWSLGVFPCQKQLLQNTIKIFDIFDLHSTKSGD